MKSINDDDIELVDIATKSNKSRVKIDDYQDKHHKKNKNKKPFKLWEKIFIGVSATFIVGCIVFYGMRLFKYYPIYNPKIDNNGNTAELIMNAIVRNTTIVYEGDGLYRISGTYVYKGSSVNNYVSYSNMLWRIIKFNTDGSADLVLADNINMLAFNSTSTSYKDSDINKYLNNYFYNKIDKDNVSVTASCNDDITDLNSITCNDRDTSNYVRLLSVGEYLNSKTDASYISGSNIWLSNTNGDKVWHINGSSLSSSTVDNMYYVKPVITLKNTAQLLGGTGSKEDPYTITKSSDLAIGTYVKLDDDTWVIYDKTDDTYRLSLDTYMKSMSFSTSSNAYNPEDKTSLAYYLNNTLYDSLKYKDKLLDTEWNIGQYTSSYNDASSKTVKCKVGLLSVADLKLGGLSDYYLLTPSTDGKVYLYSETVKDVKTSVKSKVIPTISINKLKITSGSGTKADPFVLEV